MPARPNSNTFPPPTEPPTDPVRTLTFVVRASERREILRQLRGIHADRTEAILRLIADSRRQTQGG